MRSKEVHVGVWVVGLASADPVMKEDDFYEVNITSRLRLIYKRKREEEVILPTHEKVHKYIIEKLSGAQPLNILVPNGHIMHSGRLALYILHIR